ncbi:MAG: hypothetical protein JRM80_05765 [Nitrososphaerota archaeon]|nr:hypothetical protein [Nitrososphaerota archaeon]
MNIPRRDSAFIAVTAAVMVAAFALTLGQTPGSGTTTTSPDQKSASTTSVDGLRLTLEISGTTVEAGGEIAINATESNTLATPLNVSAARSWPLQGLSMGACYESVYPFGVAVYQGRYTSANATAKPLNLYPLVPCPLLIRYISGYYFEPSSDLAVVLPGSGSPMPMAAGLASAGNYSSGTTVTKFAPGDYTVAAGDEWGTVVFLYFDVA